MRTKRQVCLSVMIFLAAAALLSGCGIFGGSSSKTKSLIVGDYDNFRVLIYEAPFSTNQSASVALGQSSLTAATQGTTASAMDRIDGVTTDADGNIWVVEENCRILQFQRPFTTGMSASVVVGKPDFTTAGCANAPTASEIGYGVGLAFDGSGNLWVADWTNNRVMEFKSPFTNGMAATLVLGQADFTHGNGACTATSGSSLCAPRDIVFDASGNLWVADGDNNRILQFKKPFSNGMAATLELGQPAATAFTTKDVNSGGLSASSLSTPNGLAFDSRGNLWVADWHNNRVLEFKSPFSNGMVASLVLGQTGFTTATTGTTSATFNGSADVAFDSGGDLYVTDDSNNRTLIFAPPFSNGMAATTVLGQADFTHGAINQGGTVGAQTQSEPFSVTTSMH